MVGSPLSSARHEDHHVGSKSLPEDFVAAVGWLSSFHKAEREAAARGDPGSALIMPFGRLDALDPETLRLMRDQFAHCVGLVRQYQQRPDCLAYVRGMLGTSTTVH